PRPLVYATLIVVLVVLLLFALGGLEGRLFAPLAVAYVTALAASLLVSLTVTPALCSYMLPGARFFNDRRDPWLLRGLKWLDAKLPRFPLRHSTGGLVASAALPGAGLGWRGAAGGGVLPPMLHGGATSS